MARHRGPAAGDVIELEGRVLVLRQNGPRLAGIELEDVWNPLIVLADFSGCRVLASSVDEYELLGKAARTL